jgi:hypothetical protein
LDWDDGFGCRKHPELPIAPYIDKQSHFLPIEDILMQAIPIPGRQDDAGDATPPDWARGHGTPNYS